MLFERLSVRANLRRMQLIDYIEDVELSASLKSLLQQQTDASHRGDGAEVAVAANTECSCAIKDTLEDGRSNSTNDSVFLPNTMKLSTNRSTEPKAPSSMPDILSAHAISKPVLTRSDNIDVPDVDEETCYLSPVTERPVPHSDDSFSQVLFNILFISHRTHFLHLSGNPTPLLCSI